MTPRRAAPAAALVAAAAGLLTLAARPSYDSGPFGALADARYGWSTRVAQGVTFTDGMLVLQNHSDRPVRLLQVAFEDGEPGLDLVGAQVAGLDRAVGAYQMLPSFPPVSAPPQVVLGRPQALHGYVIPAGREYSTHGVEVLLGVRKTVPGRATRRAVLITYQAGGRNAVARMESSLAVCAPADGASCPQEYGDG